MGVSRKWGQTAWLSVSHQAPCVQGPSMCGTWQGSAPVCGCAMLLVWVDTWVHPLTIGGHLGSSTLWLVGLVRPQTRVLVLCGWCSCVSWVCVHQLGRSC